VLAMACSAVKIPPVAVRSGRARERLSTAALTGPNWCDPRGPHHSVVRSLRSSTKTEL